MTTDRTTETTHQRNAAEWPGRALKGNEEWLTGTVAAINDRGLQLRGYSGWFNYGALRVGPLRPETIAVGDAVELIGSGRWINAVRLLPPAAAGKEDGR